MTCYILFKNTATGTQKILAYTKLNMKRADKIMYRMMKWHNFNHAELTICEECKSRKEVKKLALALERVRRHTRQTEPVYIKG